MRPLPSVPPLLGRSSALTWPAALVLSALALGGCCNAGTDNPAPSPPPETSSLPIGATSATPPRPPGQVSDALPPGPPAGDQAAPAPVPQREIAGASQILIAYKGAERAPKGVTRSKDDAKKRAAEALKKVKDGATFEDVVKQYTDDEISKGALGAVGNFERNAMPPAFADATFAMKVGDVSDVVETPQGFHIIKRTK